MGGIIKGVSEARDLSDEKTTKVGGRQTPPRSWKERWKNMPNPKKTLANRKVIRKGKKKGNQGSFAAERKNRPMKKHLGGAQGS